MEPGLKDDDQQLLQRLQHIKKLYCQTVQLAPAPSPDGGPHAVGVTAKAPLDAALLEAQFGIFVADAYEVARSMRLPAIQPLPPDANEEVEAEGDAPPALVEDEEAEEERQLLRTTRFWRELSRSPATADAISEWIKLGQLVLVQVHGSCEDERVFSAMAYLKNKHRNRLQEAHLNVAARFFHQPWFTLATFPVDDALESWHAGAPVRGRYSRG